MCQRATTVSPSRTPSVTVPPLCLEALWCFRQPARLTVCWSDAMCQLAPICRTAIRLEGRRAAQDVERPSACRDRCHDHHKPGAHVVSPPYTWTHGSADVVARHHQARHADFSGVGRLRPLQCHIALLNLPESNTSKSCSSIS